MSTDEARLAKRKELLAVSSQSANQAYFAATVAGLLVNAFSNVRHGRDKLVPVEQQWREACEDKNSVEERAREYLKTVKEKHFSLFLAFLKAGLRLEFRP